MSIFKGLPKKLFNLSYVENFKRGVMFSYDKNQPWPVLSFCTLQRLCLTKIEENDGTRKSMNAHLFKSSYNHAQKLSPKTFFFILATM